MSTFDTLIEQVIVQNSEYPALRTVIEKEILHYDIPLSIFFRKCDRIITGRCENK